MSHSRLATAARLFGRVVSFDVRPAEGGAIDIYGPDTLCSVIGIELIADDTSLDQYGLAFTG